MTRFIIATVIVIALIAGALFGLLRGRRTPMASPEVLDRVRQRNRELDAQEREDAD